ncbi:MAG: hypothetical protein JWN86_1760 [Planctomycetota bacterium]|nr:hypothetical protein [Planctomycetota bacterium]
MKPNTISPIDRLIQHETIDRVRLLDPVLFDAIQDPENWMVTGRINQAAVCRVLNLPPKIVSARLRRIQVDCQDD